MAANYKCDKCGVEGTDKKQFWHFAYASGLDLCLQCADNFNKERAQLDDEINNFVQRRCEEFFSKYIKSDIVIRVDSDNADKDEVI